ncbi:MAG: GAP family protein [Acidimicrobiia bacterium]
MSDMWLDLLPVLFAMMISPARTLAVILLLHTPRSMTTAFSYVVGMLAAMMVQGVGLAVGMNVIGLTGADRSDDLATVVGTLFVVGGVVLLVGAFKIAAAPASGGGSLASALEKLEHVDPSGAFKIGFGWIFASPKQWVFVLTAVAVIFTAQLSALASLANYVAFSVLVQLAYLVIIGGYAIARDRVSAALDVAFGWIKAHLRATAIGLFCFFGVIFLVKGVLELAS